MRPVVIRDGQAQGSKPVPRVSVRYAPSLQAGGQFETARREAGGAETIAHRCKQHRRAIAAWSEGIGEHHAVINKIATTGIDVTIADLEAVSQRQPLDPARGLIDHIEIGL